MKWGMYWIQNKCYSSKLDLKLPFNINPSFLFLFTVTIMLFSSPFVINDAFANHLSNELKWQMIFISSISACSNHNYQMMNTYYDIALQYLKLYELENISYDPLCITEKKYLLNYEKPHDVDLIILVYDEDLGERELHANQMGGLYTHSGEDNTRNHVIIICDCSNFYYSSPYWILSHELSHFILFYKNFEMSVIESLIHVNDEKYDQCLDQSTTCKSSSIKMIAGPGGYAYSVMPIYQPAVGGHTETKVVIDETKSSTPQIFKIITQWWTTDIISDEQYSNAIWHLVDGNVVTPQDDAELILTDEPLDNVQTWEQMLEDVTPTYWASQPKSDDDSMAHLSKITNKMISNDKNLLSEKKNFELPVWFKEAAALWEQDMITDIEFKKNVDYLVKEGIIESHFSSVFQDIVDESTEEKIVYTLPAWFVANAGWWSEGYVTDIEYNTTFEYLVKEGVIESHTSSASNEIVDESESIQASPPIQSPSNESLLLDPVSEEPSVAPIESVSESDKNIPVKKEDIHKLFDLVNSITDIDNRVIKQLAPAVLSFNDGNIDGTCNNLENFFMILEYLIDSNKIDQSLGQSLIAAGEIIKLDLC